MSNSDLSAFFEPKSIAVIGSFREGFFGGYVVIRSLIRGGYKGQIYPVNPNYQEVFGIRVYPSLSQVPEGVDLVLVMINSRSVPQVIRECANKAVKAVVIVADGFAERDEQGAKLQKEIVEIATGAGIRLIGPNTAGIVNTYADFYPCPYESGYDRIKRGSIALVSQSGMTNPQAFPYYDYRCGISKICDLGNKCDVDECELMEYLAQDRDTKVIAMYLETVNDGRRFLEVSKKIARTKPLLIVKSGRTKQGAKASESHTGSLAVNDKIFDALCRQAGIIRLDTFVELFEIPKIFATQPLPKGNKLGILTITGGLAVMAIDYGDRYGLKLSELSSSTASLLNSIFSGTGHMPVDIGPVMAAVKDAFSLYPEIMYRIMADPNVDALLHILWANPKGDIIPNYLKAYEAIKEKHQKPIATWIYGPDRTAIKELGVQLEDMGFPVFRDVETAVKALGLAFQFYTF